MAKTINELMKNVSLHTMDKMDEGDIDPKTGMFVVLYKDDAKKGDCNRKARIAGDLAQLDAVLCYERDREVQMILKMKIVDTYIP